MTLCLAAPVKKCFYVLATGFFETWFSNLFNVRYFTKPAKVRSALKKSMMAKIGKAARIGGRTRQRWGVTV
jgi:hypothetical protein